MPRWKTRSPPALHVRVDISFFSFHTHFNYLNQLKSALFKFTFSWKTHVNKRFKHVDLLRHCFFLNYFIFCLNTRVNKRIKLGQSGIYTLYEWLLSRTVCCCFLIVGFNMYLKIHLHTGKTESDLDWVYPMKTRILRLRKCTIALHEVIPNIFRCVRTTWTLWARWPSRAARGWRRARASSMTDAGTAPHYWTHRNLQRTWNAVNTCMIVFFRHVVSSQYA